ncbi:histidine phosphatase family protein [Stutzerimonas sp. VN223-3]|uniref:histidine phosphatase family protein n=1 Tax=Stutzerimonas sp. VN223-3 TaxID=3384601 RepID=UPI0038B5E43E
MLCAFDAPAANDEAWSALREGRAVLLLRHATAPGVGDPPGFVLEDCSTQRNLNHVGRLEAQRWGDLLRQQRISRPRVLSSRWCRALETAEQMGLAMAEPLPALDSFFAQSDRRNVQTATLRQLVNSLPAAPPVVLITHQVNITALTGVVPRSGEGLILALPVTDPPNVLAKIPPP